MTALDRSRARSRKPNSDLCQQADTWLGPVSRAIMSGSCGRSGQDCLPPSVFGRRLGCSRFGAEGEVAHA